MQISPLTLSNSAGPHYESATSENTCEDELTGPLNASTDRSEHEM